MPLLNFKSILEEGYKEVKDKYIKAGVQKSQVTSALDRFRALSNANKLKGDEKNIDLVAKNYPNFTDFEKWIKYKETEVTKSQIVKKKVVGNKIEVWNNGKIKGEIPLDKEASCNLGKHSDWCTTKVNQTEFETYFMGGVTLVYFINTSTNKPVLALAVGGVDKKVEYFEPDDTQLTEDEAAKMLGLSGWRDMTPIVNYVSSPEIQRLVDPWRDKIRNVIGKKEIEELKAYVTSHKNEEADSNELRLLMQKVTNAMHQLAEYGDVRNREFEQWMIDSGFVDTHIQTTRMYGNYLGNVGLAWQELKDHYIKTKQPKQFFEYCRRTADDIEPPSKPMFKLLYQQLRLYFKNTNKNNLKEKNSMLADLIYWLDSLQPEPDKTNSILLSVFDTVLSVCIANPNNRLDKEWMHVFDKAFLYYLDYDVDIQISSPELEEKCLTFAKNTSSHRKSAKKYVEKFDLEDVYIIEGYKEVTKKYLDAGVNNVEVKNALNRFRTLSNANKLKDSEKNIDIVAKENDFESFLKFLTRKETEKTISQVKRKKVQDLGDRIELYRNEEIVAYVPLTKDASCNIGKDTNWCTTKVDDKHFEDYFYNKELSFIYVSSTNGTPLLAIAMSGPRYAYGSPGFIGDKKEYFLPDDTSISEYRANEDVLRPHEGINPSANELIEMMKDDSVVKRIAEARNAKYTNAIASAVKAAEQCIKNFDPSNYSDHCYRKAVESLFDTQMPGGVAEKYLPNNRIPQMEELFKRYKKVVPGIMIYDYVMMLTPYKNAITLFPESKEILLSSENVNARTLLKFATTYQFTWSEKEEKVVLQKMTDWLNKEFNSLDDLLEDEDAFADWFEDFVRPYANRGSSFRGKWSNGYNMLIDWVESRFGDQLLARIKKLMRDNPEELKDEFGFWNLIAIVLYMNLQFDDLRLPKNLDEIVKLLYTKPELLDPDTKAKVEEYASSGGNGDADYD